MNISNVKMGILSNAARNVNDHSNDTITRIDMFVDLNIQLRLKHRVIFYLNIHHWSRLTLPVRELYIRLKRTSR